MTQSREPEDRERDLDRIIRSFERRITRLEDTQITGRELNASFDRVYDEIDALEEQVNSRFDRLEERFDRLANEVRELNNKFDIVMRYITGG